MIIAHYAHRLPADYDIGIIRDRAGRRGHLFDAIPELYFKAFLLRERGRFGAIQNEYSSLYLWRQGRRLSRLPHRRPHKVRHRQLWPAAD